ncbi:MAG: methyltransferase domain-containing protein [Chloroflexi bacterium]|nr:methyltransferase domain-containing protein [Chloroflexota bacterium]
MAIADVGAGDRTLDLGTDRGACLFAAPRAVGPGGHVTGVDVAPAMIAVLAQDIGARSIGNADARVMAAEPLEFPDASFDVAMHGFKAECLAHLPSIGPISERWPLSSGPGSARRAAPRRRVRQR